MALRFLVPKCEGDLVYYRGWDLPRDCLPCDRGCSNDPTSCDGRCKSGCGCPKGLVKSPIDHTKCIKPGDCPPTGKITRICVNRKPQCKLFYEMKHVFLLFNV